MKSQPSPFDSILEAVLTVSPNKQYLGIFKPTTPAHAAPKEQKIINCQYKVSGLSCPVCACHSEGPIVHNSMLTLKLKVKLKIVLRFATSGIGLTSNFS